MALFKPIFTPITGENLAVVTHNESAVPMSGEVLTVVKHVVYILSPNIGD